MVRDHQHWGPRGTAWIIGGLLAVGGSAPAWAQAADAVWIGGDDGAWSDPANWSTPDYPDNGHPAGTTYNVLIDSTAPMLDLDVTIGDLTLDGGTQGIKVDTDSPAAAPVRTLTVDGLFTWHGGALFADSIWGSDGEHVGVLHANGGITLGDATASFADWTIDSAGTLSVAGPGGLSFNQNSRLHNTAAGTIDFQSDADFLVGSDDTLLTNDGRIVKSAGTGESTINVTVDNQANGVIEARSGTLAFREYSTFAGTLTADGATLQFDSGAFDRVAHRLNGTAFEVTAYGAIYFDGNVSLSGTLTSSGDGTGAFGSSITFRDVFVEAGKTATLDFSEQSPLVLDGTLDVQGQLANAGTLRWESGTWQGGEPVVNTGTILVRGYLARNLGDVDGAGQTLVNEAEGTIVHQSSLVLNQDSVIDNRGVYEIRAGGTLIDVGSGQTGAAFLNSGTLEKTAGGGAELFDVAFSSTGTIASYADTLRIQNARAISGSIKVGSPRGSSRIQLLGDSISLQDVSFDVTHAGLIAIERATLTVPMFSGTLTSTGDGTGVVRIGDLIAADGTVFNLSTDAPLLLFGSVDSPGVVTQAGHATLTGSVIAGDGSDAGTAGFANTGTLTLDLAAVGGSGSADDPGTLINRGGSVIQWDDLSIFGDSLIRNEADDLPGSGVWDVQGDYNLGAQNWDTNQARMVNTGTLTKSAGIYASFFGVSFTNDGGLVHTRSGGFSFEDYTQTGGTLSLEDVQILSMAGFDIQGGRVIGTGSLKVELSGADVINRGGVFAPGHSIGTITVEDGSFIQLDGGAIHIELAGTGVGGVDYDQIIVLGRVDETASLAGEIRLELINGYTPMLGDSFDILLADDVVDQGYQLVALTPLAGGRSFASGIVDGGDYEALRVWVVPEPTSLAVLGLVGGMTLLRRRRG